MGWGEYLVIADTPELGKAWEDLVRTQCPSVEVTALPALEAGTGVLGGPVRRGVLRSRGLQPLRQADLRDAAPAWWCSSSIRPT